MISSKTASLARVRFSTSTRSYYLRERPAGRRRVTIERVGSELVWRKRLAGR